MRLGPKLAEAAIVKQAGDQDILVTEADDAADGAGERVAELVQPGLGEEVFFRGLVQFELGNWLGSEWAIVLTSLSFGLAHWISRSYFVYASLMGCVFGLLVLITNNLSSAVAAHASFDAFALWWGMRSLNSNDSR